MINPPSSFEIERALLIGQHIEEKSKETAGLLWRMRGWLMAHNNIVKADGGWRLMQRWWADGNASTAQSRKRR
jgi:hypothetical protein